MQFVYMQSKVFPIYFSVQTVSTGILYFTSPADTPFIIWIVLCPGSIGNLAFVGSWTYEICYDCDTSYNSLMNKRHRLEKSTGTKYFDDIISPEMKALNMKFGIAHGSLFFTFNTK